VGWCWVAPSINSGCDEASTKKVPNRSYGDMEEALGRLPGGGKKFKEVDERGRTFNPKVERIKNFKEKVQQEQLNNTGGPYKKNGQLPNTGGGTTRKLVS